MAEETVALLLVGGGRMGEALLGGLLDRGLVDPTGVAVAEALGARRDELARRFPGVAVVEAPVPATAAIVAVKPPDVADACRAVGAAGVRRLLSVAAGVTLDTLEEAVAAGAGRRGRGDVAVLRAMPNTPALVGSGAAAVAGGTAAGEDDLAWAEEVLGAVGVVVRVPESGLDAVTGLSGSGPAYVFLLIESLVEAGVREGLPRPVAEALASQTVRGAAELVQATGDHPAALRAQVTSPGGTTAAALAELERAGFRGAVLDAVRAATTRSRELGS